jgi:hypothetical protein
MPSFVETIRMVSSFANLPVGWNFGAGKPSSLMALYQSMAMLSHAFNAGLKEVEAFPGTDGEVQLNFYKDDTVLEMIFEINGTVSVTVDDGIKSVRLGKNVSQGGALRFLKEFEFNKCHSYVSSILNIITVSRVNDLPASHSDPRTMVAAFRLSRKNAPTSEVAASAYTPKITTRVQPGHLSSFGQSRTNVSPKAAKLSTV